jgi:hypothetical protein
MYTGSTCAYRLQKKNEKKKKKSIPPVEAPEGLRWGSCRAREKAECVRDMGACGTVLLRGSAAPTLEDASTAALLLGRAAPDDAGTGGGARGVTRWYGVTP